MTFMLEQQQISQHFLTPSTGYDLPTDPEPESQDASNLLSFCSGSSPSVLHNLEPAPQALCCSLAADRWGSRMVVQVPH